jgi:hypothetical protein
VSLLPASDPANSALAAYVHDALQRSTGIRAGVAAAKYRESSFIVSNVNVRVTNYAVAHRLTRFKIFLDR